MKKHFFLAAVIGITAFVLIGVSGALGYGSDQGRRLAGPFCVGKPNLLPLTVVDGKKVSRAGVVRSVAATEACESTEIRKFGVAIPQTPGSSTTIIGTAGPAGAQGAQGAQGVPGVQGDKGDSVQGEKGEKGDTGATGATGPAGSLEGTGLRWICKEGQGQGSLKDGGTGEQPDCNEGADFAFQVVTKGFVSFD